MNAQNLKKLSETDWGRLSEMSDEEIDTSDITPLDETFFANARLRVSGKKASVTLDVDVDVLQWLKAQGEEF